ncbi:DedA family protein [Maritimibacter sp. DP07]|uniref:DedA family protein n=1 Tax=Maritimibacter harenae TaxID=2606218 RepID=A0A845LYU6_9RHOB|nr:VTT domain-containing protein [Maritimibacter harenae]MZR13190.1 DedA family protein [Maritimibacter harenae]
MSALFLELVPAYGVLTLGIATFLSCIAMPIPASLIMLAGGAFAAGGDLDVGPTYAACLLGAVTGDQAGYAIGARGAGLIDRIEASSRARARLIARARRFSIRWGAPGVFFSRWLVSPLGPYVNLLFGAARAHRATFTFWSVTGEIVWVSIYVGLGYAFSGYIAQIAEVAGNIVGLLAALVLAVVLARIIWSRHGPHPS